MSENPSPESTEPTGDELRQHSQDPAEGPDPDDTKPDVPRVHPENATEG